MTFYEHVAIYPANDCHKILIGHVTDSSQLSQCSST